MDVNAVMMNVQRQIEQEWLSRLRRDVRNIDRLRYVHVLPTQPVRPLPDIHIVAEHIGDCAICQEDFSLGEEYVALQCNPVRPHKFHKGCIEPWLVSHDTCPTCRGKV